MEVLVEIRDEFEEEEGGEGTGVRRKRNLEERSPEQAGNRKVSRMRFEEAEMNEKIQGIRDQLRKDYEELEKRLEKEGTGVEEMKKVMKDSFEVMFGTIEGIMTLFSDSYEGEQGRVAKKEKEMETRLEGLKEKMEKMEADNKELEKTCKKVEVMESKRGMEEKVSVAERQVKLLDMDFERETEDRREIINKVVRHIRHDTRMEDKDRMNDILGRTRIYVLGRKTVKARYGDSDIWTVPILLEARSEGEKAELDRMLRAGGYFPAFHWPSEMLEYIRSIKSYLRVEGKGEERYHAKMRTDRREGKMVVKVELKDRKGGMFQLEGYWGIPPVDRKFWSPSMGRDGRI